MSDERIQTHKVATESGQKFDYWVATLTGAVLAYSAQHYCPRRFDSVPSLLEPVALLLFTVALWFSYRRIECDYKHAQKNHALLEGHHFVVTAENSLKDHPADPILKETVTGKRYTRVELEQQIRERQTKNSVIEDDMNALDSKGEFAYRLRFVFLVAGFAVLIAAKVIQPYL